MRKALPVGKEPLPIRVAPVAKCEAEQRSRHALVELVGLMYNLAEDLRRRSARTGEREELTVASPLARVSRRSSVAKLPRLAVHAGVSSLSPW